MLKWPQNNLISISLLTLLTVLTPHRPWAKPTLGQGSVDQIRPLLPRQFEVQIVSPADPLARQLDLMTLRILSSSSGKIFCQAVPENEEWVRQAFFLQNNSAEVAMGICRGHFSQKKFNSRPHSKKFVLIKSDDPAMKVDGWTSNLNETFLFVHTAEMNEARLTRTLIHEMAVSFDAKEGIGMLGKVDWPGLSLIETAQACTAMKILRRGSIKHALTAIRAFEVERKIATELKLPLPEGFANWSHLSCQQKFEFMQPYVTALQPAIQAEALLNQLMDGPNCTEHDFVESQDHVAIETLARMNLTWAHGAVRNACDFMTEGWPYLAGLSFRGGPGPRIGGGWSQLRTTEPDIAKPHAKPITGGPPKIGDQKLEFKKITDQLLIFKEDEHASKK